MFTITESDRAFWLEGPNGQRMRLCDRGAEAGALLALSEVVAPRLAADFAQQADDAEGAEAERDAALARAEAAEKRVKELDANIRTALQAHNAMHSGGEACAASAVLAHQLVADVLAALRPVDPDSPELWEAVAKLHAAGVTVQPVDTDRVKRLEAALRDFAEHGTRYDTDPTHIRPKTVDEAETFWSQWTNAMDRAVMRRAREALGIKCKCRREPGDSKCDVHDTVEPFSEVDRQPDAKHAAFRGPITPEGISAACIPAQPKVRKSQAALRGAPANIDTWPVPTVADFERAPVGAHVMRKHRPDATKGRDGLWATKDGGHFAPGVMASQAALDGIGSTVIVPGDAPPRTDFPSLRQAVMRGDTVEAVLGILAHLEAQEGGGK